MKNLFPTTASLILAVLMHADVRGQESSAPPPEMKALERLVGAWEVDTVGIIPEERRSTAFALKRELVLGGRFVQEMGGFDDKGKPTFTGMYTYDSNKKAYRYWLFLSGGGYSESTGTWDYPSQTFTFKNRPSWGGTGVITLRVHDKAAIDVSLIAKNADGKVSHHIEGKSVRQQ